MLFSYFQLPIVVNLVHNDSACANNGNGKEKSKSEGDTAEGVEEEMEKKVKHRSCNGTSGGKKTVAAQVSQPGLLTSHHRVFMGKYIKPSGPTHFQC